MVKKLICPACGDVIAEAAYRRWPGNLVITDVEGHRVNPLGGAVLRRIAERELAAATDGPSRDVAATRLEFIDRSSAELLYDLRCRRGHATLRTAPQIVRAMRRSSGDWAELTGP